MQNSLTSKVFSIALLSLLQVGLVQNTEAGSISPRAQYPLAQLAQDGEIVMQLTGDAYRYIDSARVVHGEYTSRLRRDIRAILGPWRNGGRQLTLKADSSARTGFFNRIEGLQAGSPSVLVPLQLEVVSQAQGSSPFLQRAEEDEPEQLAMRDEYTYIADQYDFIKSITEIATEYEEIFDNAIPLDRNLSNCRIVECPKPESIGVYAPHLAPIYNFQPQSPAIVGSVLEITRSRPGGSIEVTLENSITGEVIELEVHRMLDQYTVLLPDYAIQGKLTVTEPDGYSSVLHTDYAVVEPDVLPFDAFDPNTTGYSLTNSYLLSVVSQRVYRNLDEDYGTSEYCDNQDEVFLHLGLNVRDCLDQNGVFSLNHIAGIPYPIMTDTQTLVLENDNVLIIGFAGTQINYLDVVTDASFFPVVNPAWARGLHSGFFGAHNPRLPDGRYLYQEILEYASAANAEGKKVWLTGHSLGGALAQITAFRLKWLEQIDVQGIVTFGAPRIAGYLSNFDRHFNNEFGQRALRWVNYGDPVPLLPPAYMIGGQLVNIEQDGTITPPDASEMIYAPMPSGFKAEHMNYFPILYNKFIQTEFASDFVHNNTQVNGFISNIWPSPE